MRKSIFSYIFNLISGIIIISLASCRPDADPTLLHADSIMEEHPDSSLMILETYRLPENCPDQDRALYGMLLTQARYKNFIDETNDSLINESINYFLNHNDKEFAARSLFLAGMIRMNAEKLGEAAVSFHKGLDIARDCKAYFWVGQCATGLFTIFGSILDGSAQMKYANEAYEAFSLGEMEDWKNYAKLNIARAYNNKGVYDKAIAEAEELLAVLIEAKDSLVLAETYDLIGTSLFCMGNHSESLKKYAEAYKLDSEVITSDDLFNVSIMAPLINGDSITEDINILMKYATDSNEIPAFLRFANEGNYKDAYEGIERYRMRQDSVLSLILRNNVAETIDQYNFMKQTMHQSQIKSERIAIALLAVFFVLCFFISLILHRKKLQKNEFERQKTLVILEDLKSGFVSQLKKLDTITAQNRHLEEKNKLMYKSLVETLHGKYSAVNRLCDDFYEDRHINKKKESHYTEIHRILKDFSDNEFLKDVGCFVDKYTDGLFSSFNQDFPELKEEARRLFLFLILNFSSRTISVIFNQEIDIIYNRKSRIKKKIKKSSAARKDDYLEFL